MADEAGHAVHDAVTAQLDGLTLDPERPLIVSDVDEVLACFLAGLEAFLARRDLWLDLRSYALHGNIKRRASGEVVAVEEVHELLLEFFLHATELLIPVSGAADALRALAARAQIVVLSNVPLPQRQARARWLQRHGMDYPLVCNIGLKGAVLRHLAARVAAPVFFLDDIPHNLASVAEAAPEVIRLHFIADPRLAALIPPAASCHFAGSSWPEARRFIEARLGAAGF